jgi:hypothetical protein
LLLAWACASPQGELTREQESRIAKSGSAAAAQLRQRLVGRLTAALDSVGAAGAIEVCATEAPALTAEIARVDPSVVELKRTSTRVRNPRNAPDELEARALELFEAEAQAGRQLPEHYVQAEAPGVFRYYEPLRILPLCLQCHGPREQLQPAVQRVLADRYPQDRAVGYTEGDFRGLIRVTVRSDSAVAR